MNQLSLFEAPGCKHPYGRRCGPLDMGEAPETWICKTCGQTWSLPSLGTQLATESPTKG